MATGHEFAGAAADYGSTGRVESQPTSALLSIKRSFPRSQRRSLNVVAIVMGVLLPWCVFLVTYSSLSFDLRYHQPYIAYSLVAIALSVVLSFGALTYTHLNQKRAGEPHVEAKWYMFIFVTSAFYWLLAVEAGNANFDVHMRPFHDLASMNTYPGIDPAMMRGEMMMDAGKIIFRNGSRIDFTKAMGFRNGNTYCVAPIVFGDSAMDHYDFWAVGMDCCSAQGSAAYHCGQFSNPKAIAGVRMMHDSERPYYRLAVQQAEAKYKIAATHPLFFTWLADPAKHTEDIHSKGMQHCLMYIVSVFFAHLFLVVTVVLAFAKLGQ